MNKIQAQPQVEAEVHPLQKSYMLVSNRHLDYENLSAFEAVSMSAVLVLSVFVGVLSTVI